MLSATSSAPAIDWIAFAASAVPPTKISKRTASLSSSGVAKRLNMLAVLPSSTSSSASVALKAFPPKAFSSTPSATGLKPRSTETILPATAVLEPCLESPSMVKVVSVA